MSDDSGALEPKPPIVRPSELPIIVDLRILRVPYEATQYEFVDSIYADVRETLAFEVVVEGEIRSDQATAPALFIGEVQIMHIEKLDENLYRYRAFPDEEERMVAGAPIGIGWFGFPQERNETKFLFEPPSPSDEKAN